MDERLLVSYDTVRLLAGHVLIVWTIALNGEPIEKWQVYREASGKDDGQNIIGGSHPGTRAEATQIGISEAARLGLVKKIDAVR